MRVKVIEQAAYDAAWDDFLAHRPDGHHVQSSLWGQLKAKFGWQVARILAYEEDEKIVGGAQILIRPLPIWGKIGYISKGPVVALNRFEVMKALFGHIEQLAQTRRLIVLSIQPPENDPLYMNPLREHHFKPSSFYVVPPTTVLVDLQPSEDEILAQMKQKTRYNIRLAARKGVVIREGEAQDLPTFYRLTQVTGARNEDYAYYDLEYYQEAWHQFAPHGLMKLFLAYYDNEPLGALIAIAFGKWAVYKWGASSNAHRDLMPNNLLQWEAIRWSKEKGCAFYDLGGISPPIAEAINQGQDPATIATGGTARFKLGFGDMITFPDSFDNSYGIRPRWLVQAGVAAAWKFRFLRGLVRGATSS